MILLNPDDHLDRLIGHFCMSVCKDPEINKRACARGRIYYKQTFSLLHLLACHVIVDKWKILESVAFVAELTESVLQAAQSLWLAIDQKHYILTCIYACCFASIHLHKSQRQCLWQLWQNPFCDHDTHKNVCS